MERAALLHDCTVVKRTDFGHGYFELFLDAPALAANFKAGQFVNVRVRDELYPLLRRPFSSFDILKDVRGKATGISLLGHVVGQGTRMLSRMEAGSKLHINGPLGHGFELPENADTRVIMVGGGIGLAPFLHLTRQWHGQRELVLLAGGRAQKDLAFMKRFTGTGANVLLATEDGSAGVKGRVTVLLEAELKALRGKPAVVLTCGPWAMMKAVAEICMAAGVPSYASLESVMACGYGVCNGCVARVKADNEHGFRYAKTCVEGTVMDCEALVW
ncbi:MAG: dihydroorotate dehydrogenase electron transfer subunit [Planctomycetes bacterium]|nr:dihydroorotate dehydrogenase electron transfer subunit [Planctomycetota bacterium]MCW8136230.1 dihydroorotate dehydrogenase electron transfer subunit [Planctomycetota bacterium]